MTEEFDAYRKWLGIPPRDQPPHHYRLLGLAALESDPDVISNAADRQMAHVRNYQSGQHSKLSQQILNELSAAKICLLNPDRKAEYDAKLRVELKKKSVAKKQKAAATPPLAAPPVPELPPPVNSLPSVSVTTAAPPTPGPGIALDASPTSIRTPSTATRARSRGKKRSLTPIVLVGVALLFLIIAVIVILSQGNGDTPEPRSKNNVSQKKRVAQSGRKKKPNRQGRKIPLTDSPPSKLPSLSAPNTPDPDPSVPDNTLSREEEFQKFVDGTRKSMANRDSFGIEHHLSRLNDLKKSPQEIETVAELAEWEKSLISFWENVSKGIETLDLNKEFQYDDDNYVLTKREDSIVTFTVNDKTFSSVDVGLATKHAVAFATQGADDAYAKTLAATFLSFDGEGTRNQWQLETAQALWRAAAIASSRPDTRLAKHLGIDPEEIANLTTTAPSETPSETPAKPARLPVPSKSKLSSARKRMENDYKEELLAVTSVGELADLAAQVEQAALDEEDPLQRHALWDLSRKYYYQAGNFASAFAVVDTMAEQFGLDPLQQKYDDLDAFKAIDNEALLRESKILFQESVDEKRFKLAVDFGDLAIRALKKLKKFDEAKEIKAEIKAVRKMAVDQNDK